MERYDDLITPEMMQAGHQEMSVDPDAIDDEVIRDVFSAMMNVVRSRTELKTQYLRWLAESPSGAPDQAQLDYQSPCLCRFADAP